jgi:hypothetical protein
MVLFLEGRLPRLILAAYLAFAVMGIGTFAAAGPLRFVDFWENEFFSGVFFAPIDTIDCPIEGETIMSRASGYSFSPWRTGSPRILMLSDLQNTGSVLVQSSLRAIEEANYPDIKKAIRLKLRI